MAKRGKDIKKDLVDFSKLLAEKGAEGSHVTEFLASGDWKGHALALLEDQLLTWRRVEELKKKKVKKKKLTPIPFDSKGNLLPEARVKWRGGEYGPPKDVVWKDNYSFIATLTYVEGSKNTMWWEDRDGHTYPMFLSRFAAALKHAKMEGNKITGRWTFVRGCDNYSICVDKGKK